MRPRPSAILPPGRSVPASWPLACARVPPEGVLRTLPSAWRPRCPSLRVGPEERPWLSLAFPWRPDAELRPCIYGHRQSSLKTALQMSIGVLTLPVGPQDGLEDARARASQRLAPRSHWPPWWSPPSLCFPPSHTLSGGGRERLGRGRDWGGGGSGMFCVWLTGSVCHQVAKMPSCLTLEALDNEAARVSREDAGLVLRVLPSHRPRARVANLSCSVSLASMRLTFVASQSAQLPGVRALGSSGLRSPHGDTGTPPAGLLTRPASQPAEGVPPSPGLLSLGRFASRGWRSWRPLADLVRCVITFGAF